MLVSDQGSHFKNAVLARLTCVHHVKHRLTASYSSWHRSTVDSLMCSILEALRAIQAELMLALSDWTKVIPAVGIALNFTSLDRLGALDGGIARAPLEVMTGFRPTLPILQVVPFKNFVWKAKTISFARTAQTVHIERPQKKLYWAFQVCFTARRLALCPSYCRRRQEHKYWVPVVWRRQLCFSSTCSGI